MEAGLQVFTDAGTLQVDSNYRNNAYYDYFDVYVPPMAGAGISPVTLNVDPNYIHAYRVLTPNAPVAFLLSGSRALVVGKDNIGTSVRIYRFRRDGVGPRSNFGLEVFDASGGLVFSSETKYMKVLDYITYWEWGNDSSSFTRWYGKRPAVIVGSMGASGRLSGTPGRWIWRQRLASFAFGGDNSAAFNASGLVAVELYDSDDSPGFLDYESTSTNAIIIDSSQLP